MLRLGLAFLATALILVSISVAQEKQEPAKKKVVTTQEKVIPTGKEAKKDVPWFDLQNCAMCKCLSETEGLMEAMHWETHVIPNGMLSVCTIPDDKRKDFAQCKKEMEAVAKKLESGESLPLCGFCMSYGELIAAGAKETEIETKNGMISLFTSDDPKVVAKIQEHARKTIKEYAAFTASQPKSVK
jgi:hypothetical protein